MPRFEQIFYSDHQGDPSDSKTCILIHGAGGNSLYWPPEIRRLAGYRMLALDLPGHGKSGGYGCQSIRDYAKCVTDWMLGIGAPRAYVAGHSMGGAIAIAMALQFPQQVRGLVLVGCGNKLSVAPWLLEATASAVKFKTAVEKIVQWSFYPETPVRLKKLATQRMLESRPSGLHSDLIACDRFETGDQLRSINCPALVIHGEDDKMIPIAQARFLAASIPNARLEIVPKAGHMVMLENPKVVSDKITEFFAAISS